MALDTLRNQLNLESTALYKLSLSIIHPDLILLRYLRCNRFDIAKSYQHIKSNIEWREENKVVELCSLQPDDILGCSIYEVNKIATHWHCNYDNIGRPVLYKKYDKLNIENLEKISSVDKLIRYHIWEQEACLRICYEQTFRLGYIVDTLFIVIDLQNMSLRQIQRDFVPIMKGVIQIDQKQYPETLGQMLIINAPSTFSIVWSVLKGWLDPVTASKISIVSSRNEWLVTLRGCIPQDSIPLEYGGTAPSLSFEKHPYSVIFDPIDRDSTVEAKSESVTLRDRCQCKCELKAK